MESAPFDCAQGRLLAGIEKEGKKFKKKLVIVVDKRLFGFYPCFRRDKHCEISERKNNNQLVEKADEM